MAHEQRAYPMACRSLYCGQTGFCPTDCPHLPEKQAFLAWVVDNRAQVVDPVWAPTIWQATVKG